MKKYLVMAIIVFLTCSLAAQAQQPKPEQKPNDKAAVDVAGNWAMTIETSMGTGTPTLVLKQDAEKITGTYTGRFGTFALEGTIKERTISFSLTMAAEGQSLVVTFTGDVATDAQTMKGKAAFGDMGEAPWSAKREKTPE
jgi:hypothetical protein